MTERLSEITAKLEAWSKGDPAALGELMPLVVTDLRRAAQHYFMREDSNHTLQPTALVNEVCLRLMDLRKVSWDSRKQFFSFAGQLMRRLLIDYARSRKAAKRGEHFHMVSLTDPMDHPDPALVDLDTLLDVHRVLERFEAIDSRAAQIVELRFFTGLNIEETAAALEISKATVKRDWSTAQRWLARELERDFPPSL